MCNECADLSRRSFLARSGKAALAAGALASGVLASGVLASGMAVTPAMAKTGLSPAEALARLKAGNERFVAAPQLCEAELANNRGTVAKGQSPWATIVSCADSRVPPELVFGGVGLGELFVARNAGNLVDTDVLGTIEYGAEHLGSPLVVVMGHSRCGAVQAACEVAEKHTKLPGSIGKMVASILPSAEAEHGKPGDFVDNVVRANARSNAERVISGSEIVRELVHENKVKVIYARYDLDSGKVEFLG